MSCENFIEEMAQVLTELGEACVLKVETGDSFDPVTGAKTPGTTTNYNAYCAPYPYDFEDIDNQNILDGDIRVVMSKTEVRPKITDRLEFDGVTHKIIRFTPVRGFGLGDIVYEMQLRL
jgi:hypothetical protein